MKHIVVLIALILTVFPAHATPLTGTFPSIDGGTLAIEDWRGRPVLVVNTASRCAFTRQYDALQRLYDNYADQGLVVLAVPSDDFRQEFSTAGEVKEFCEVNFDLTIPMTDITKIRGHEAHPFYRSLREFGFVPRWNFNKVLIGPDGNLVETFGSTVKPLSPAITRRIEALLN